MTDDPAKDDGEWDDKQCDLLDESELVVWRRKEGRKLTMELPTATLILNVNLSFIETVTADTCSAALPTMGSKIRPMNSFEIPPALDNPSIESTSHSAVTATRIVTTTRRPRVIGRDNSGISTSSSP